MASLFLDYDFTLRTPPPTASRSVRQLLPLPLLLLIAIASIPLFSTSDKANIKTGERRNKNEKMKNRCERRLLSSAREKE